MYQRASIRTVKKPFKPSPMFFDFKSNYDEENSYNDDLFIGLLFAENIWMLSRIYKERGQLY